jgi:hypothetical protein
MRTQMSLVTARALAVGALLGLLTASGGPVTIAHAQSQPTTFVDRLKYSRAVEAAIWARPLTGVKALMDGLQRDAGVGYNDIGYFSKVQNSKFKWPTSNATTPYVVGYWNAEKEPVVVEIPPATADGLHIRRRPLYERRLDTRRELGAPLCGRQARFGAGGRCAPARM